MSEEIAHSRIGASSASRWFACPGSVDLSSKVDPVESSEYAEEGTAAHELGEVCLLKEQEAVDFLGQEFNGFKVDKDMADAVQIYLDTVRAELGPGRLLHVEKRFHLDWIDSDLFGTNDACIEEPFGKLTVIDYKHGKGVPVEVEENKQLLYYGLGAFRESADCETIEFIIVQPRAAHVDGPVRRWTTTPERLAEFEAELEEAVAATRLPDAPLFAGDHCRWCPAQPVCPELRQRAFDLARAEFDDTNITHLPEPHELSKEQIVKLLDSRSMLESWLNSVSAHAKALAHKENLPSYKLVARKGHKKWIDENKVIKVLEGYGTSIYQPSKLKSPAQMAKVVDEELLEGLFETPIIGEALVPETDRRPAINPSTAVEDFS